jgi:hypothetical protein
MLVEYSYFRNYLFSALEAAPSLFGTLLEGLTEEEADRRPDPNRFTLREVIAHLADWDPVFLDRMTRIRFEDHPTLPGYDEGQWAIDHDYAHTDWREQLASFTERRQALVAFLHSCGPDDWARTANRPEIGILTIESQALLIPLHDAYHLRQVSEWRHGAAQ